jgi:hypothetical protein
LFPAIRQVLGERAGAGVSRMPLPAGVVEPYNEVMAEPAGFPIGNVLLFAALVFVPTAAFWAVLRLSTLVSRIKRLRPGPPVPLRPPIQILVADLRRVRRVLAGFKPGTPMARRLGTRQAYDALLAEACDAVNVEQRLGTFPEGVEREMERLRLEGSLRSAGLAIP